MDKLIGETNMGSNLIIKNDGFKKNVYNKNKIHEAVHLMSTGVFQSIDGHTEANSLRFSFITDYTEEGIKSIEVQLINDVGCCGHLHYNKNLFNENVRNCKVFDLNELLKCINAHFDCHWDGCVEVLIFEIHEYFNENTKFVHKNSKELIYQDNVEIEKNLD